MAMPSIPTLFCINAVYGQHAAACIVSLLVNNPDLSFDIVIVSTEPLGASEDKLKRTVARFDNCTLKVMCLDASSGMTLPVRALHYTIDTYTRLWVADFFADDVDRVLYLDSDMVVVAGVGELWNTDLGDCVIAAVTIPGSTRCAAYGIPERFGYFQSGVMVIDLKRWRDEKMFDRLLDYTSHNADKIVDADQDVLNACLYDRRRPLPYVWNVIAPFYFNYHPLGISDAELREVRRDARIIHFNGPSKPWSYLCRHPRTEDYWKYLRLTEWRDFKPADRNFLNWGKKTFGPSVLEPIRGLFRKAKAAAR
jgi:lipopolysaccharide biosynthesis glycosyltransferase